MKMKKSDIILEVIFAVAFIFFWLAVIYIKLDNFEGFKREMNSQIFPSNLALSLSYFLPLAWFTIAALLISERTRLIAMFLNFMLFLAFSIYVGLAVAEAYRYIPCSCAGLFDFDWNEQLYFNLIVTVVAATGLIFTYKEKERRKAVWTR